MANSEVDTIGIAIIGMSGRFPGAPDVRAYWENLCAGRESIETFDEATLLASGVDPSALADPTYVRAGPVLDGIDLFDAPLFDVSPSEARLLDPQHRLFLECAWEALEHGGYRGATGDLSVGVYASSTISTYMLNNLMHLPSMRRGRDGLNMATLQICVANDKDYVSTRVAFKLDLRGPAYTVQSACSSSLMAVHVACQALMARECDLALAGGASIKVPQRVGYFHEPGSIVSPDGRCRAFDADGNGTVFGSGVGVVLLRRLEDALKAGDPIWAVVRGSAANNDGSLKMGFTAPSLEAQACVIEEAIELAGVSPDTISYVEAHGTGTHLGDPVEVAALTQAFRAGGSRRKQFCAIGSVKTNIGHLEGASGVAGLIKLALMLHHKEIPASLHFRRPNPQLDLENSPYFVNTALGPWTRANGIPRRAGLTSLGVGGTNVHLVLEEAPERPRTEDRSTRPWQLLTLSAHSLASLDAVTGKLAAFLGEHPEISLADVAYTLNVGRASLRHRRIAVCRDVADARSVLSGAEPARLLTRLEERSSRPVVFMFPGQGTQYANMGLELLAAEPTFRCWVDTCAEILRPALGKDLRTSIYPGAGGPGAGGVEVAAAELEQTAITQPALFVVEYALARAWMERGVTPSVLMGHSVGELVAACLAGVFSLEDALRLIALRGRLVQELPRGAMLSVALGPDEVKRHLNGALSIAAVNESGRCVVSGPTAAIEACSQELTRTAVDNRRLRTSHAFHSAMLDPALERYVRAVSEVKRHAPAIRCLSNLTGTWLTDEEAQDPEYWAQQMRRPVLFAEELRCVLSEGPAVLLEVGPGASLTRFAKAHPLCGAEHAVARSMRHASETGSDVAVFLGALGQLWLHGVAVDWKGHWRGESRRREPIPTYCFDRKRYWIDAVIEPWSPAISADGAGLEAASPDGEAASSETTITNGGARPDISTPFALPRTPTERVLAQIWGELLGIDQVGIYDNFFELGGDSVLGVQVASKANARGMRLSPKHLFDHQCVADLAAAVDAGTAAPFASADDARGPQPLLPNQHWILERMNEYRSWVSITVLEARDSIDLFALQEALRALRHHHSALRTRFVASDAGWFQEVVDDPPPQEVPCLDLSHLAGQAFHARVDACAKEASDRVDLESGDVLRAVVVRGNPAAGKNDRLILAIHHWVQDQWGERILMQDLEAAYGQRRRARPIELAPTATSMTGFAAVLAERAQAAEGSAEQREWLRPARAEVRSLPWRKHAGARSPARVTGIERTLDEAETALLLGALQRSRRVSLEETTVSAALSAVAAWSGERNLVVDVLMSARQVDLEGVDLTRALGWFSTIYPLHVDLRGASTPIAELERTVAAMRQVRHREQEYGMLRYLSTDAALRARLAAMPQADLFLAYFGKMDAPEAGYARAVGEGFFRVDPEAADMKRTMMGSFRYAIEIAAFVRAKQLHVGWLVNEDLLPRDEAERLADDCVRNLRTLGRSGAAAADRRSGPQVAGAVLASEQQLNDILAELHRGLE
jgi:acyl transferase domain-containing protein